MTATQNTPLPTIEIERGSDPTHTILWMHGLGADGNDFVPIIDELALPSDISVRFVFPHAPMRAVTINKGFVMRAWYDVLELSFNRAEDEEGLRDSQRAIELLLERERQRGIMPGRIVLAGFSQGGAMALQTGLRYPEKLAGIMALSCYLPMRQSLATESHCANYSTAIFMAHGNLDSVVPMSLATASRKMLLESGYAVEWHDYPMAHSVCADEMADISSWLQRVLV